jgi:hypothetical protein
MAASVLVILAMSSAKVLGQTGWLNGYYRGGGLTPECLNPSYPYLVGGNCLAGKCPPPWTENLGIYCHPHTDDTMGDRDGGPYGCNSFTTYRLFYHNYQTEADCLMDPWSYKGCHLWPLTNEWYPNCPDGYTYITQNSWAGGMCCYTGCPPTYMPMQPYYCESTNKISATCQSGRVVESDNLCYFPCLQGFTGK